MSYALPRSRKPGALRRLAGALGLLLALGLLVTLAVPALANSLTPPHTFFGAVTIGTEVAPNDTPVVAKIGGVTMLTGAVTDGVYTLKVPADDPNTETVKEGGVFGDTVDFFVNGILAGSYNPFQSGGFTSLPLNIADGEEPPVTYDLEVTSVGCCDITVAYGEVTDTVGAGTTQTYNDIDEGVEVTLTAVETETCGLLTWQIDADAPVTDNPVTVTMDDDHTAVATCGTIETPVDSDITVALVEGWNTFSTPIAMDGSMDTWGEFKTVNGLDVIVALRYDGEDGIWIICQDLDPLEVLEGYYVCMASSGIAGIIPSHVQSAPPVKLLSKGLNCIGLASLEDVDVKTFLTSVYEVNSVGYTLVINPPINGAGDWNNNVYLRDGLNPPTMKVGRAYWVNMLNPGYLVGFTSTPLEP